MDGLYRSVWRWHLVAGLLVLPFLAWLAVTGGLYLYKPEIERAVYADWLRVEARPALPLSVLAKRVSDQTGGRVTQIAKPVAPESWRMTIALPDGAKRTTFVDPGDGRVLGTTRPGGLMGLVRELHSLVITGPVGNAVIEIAAGWTIVLVLTGVWLWASKPGFGARGPVRGRRFWRDLHASTGIVAGAVILFLAVTGMPWSGVWGKGLQGIVAAQGWGRPKSPAPGGHGEHGGAATLPWSMQRAGVPMGHGGDIGPDRALAAAGLRGGWTLSFPATPGAPYLVTAPVVRADDARAVYVDAGLGRVLQDARYADFGGAAQAIEWGIAVHQGQQYGEVNRLVMLAGCAAILLLVISAPVMWLKRRPKGLGLPPGRSGRGLAALMAGAGLLFPLTGLTMLAALLVERAGRRLAD
ncbi:PepSY-associated TM helix domain-containing protein [Sphingomonas yantingensis]|uniref:Putative iron-regulated membrane protein n=1 Tax=Sphingomonas yantingensis TaxID=1241761 RepID=A0A7W9ANU3_9SPHN|nr:PepSY domain-containing protein [Sphingomonas yantingensis]MBB5697840.1 putative iron-regulated membrane protein [Sphingomonas yantingensis]